jgi:hypothetical protein
VTTLAAEPAMKDCPATGCEARIAQDLVMCHLHWARVPLPLRQRIRTKGDAGHATAEAIRLVAETLEQRAAA